MARGARQSKNHFFKEAKQKDKNVVTGVTDGKLFCTLLVAPIPMITRDSRGYVRKIEYNKFVVIP